MKRLLSPGLLLDRLLPSAEIVSNDEESWGLSERVHLTPDSKARHRYQYIGVIRSDRPALFTKDLGRAEQYVSDEFDIPGGELDTRTGRGMLIEHVGELRYAADQLRAQPSMAREIEPSNLQEQWHMEVEEKAQRRRRSVIGPNFRKESVW